jgi:hypothetical protein
LRHGDGPFSPPRRHGCHPSQHDRPGQGIDDIVAHRAIRLNLTPGFNKDNVAQLIRATSGCSSAATSTWRAISPAISSGPARTT